MKPWLIAHRGGAAEAFENSLAAFHHAISIGCDSIEVDLRATLDGTIVVMHDETVDRTTTGHGRVGDLTLSQIQDLKLKNDEPIPTLEDLLRVAKETIALHLEVKEEGFEKKLVEFITSFDLVSSVHVISFNLEVLHKINQLRSQVSTGYLFDKKNQWKSCPSFSKLVLPSVELLDAEFCQLIHAQSKAIHTWVVNSEEKLPELLSFGVKGIITDTPRVFSSFWRSTAG